MNRLSCTAVVTGVVVLAAVVVVYAGVINIAADSPHWNAASHVIGLVRDRSIAVRADGTTVPDLADPDLVAIGAEHYSAMCAGCHLAPGVSTSALQQGLYPVPPDFSTGMSLPQAEAFWVIKHGIKMSAMPAWGRTHDDQTIWAIVAFLQQLPTLDAKEYALLTGASGDAEHTHGADHHDHEHEASSHEEGTNGAVAAPGDTTIGDTSVVTHIHTN